MLGTSLASCLSAQQRGVIAYKRGRFAEASEHFADAAPGPSNDPEDLHVLAAAGMDYTVDYLVEKAAALEAKEVDGLLPFREAIAFYEAALRAMSSNHSRYREVWDARQRLQDALERARQRYRMLVGEFSDIVERADFVAAVPQLKKLANLLRRVGGDEPRATDVLRLAEAAMQAGQHEVAAELVGLADRIRREPRTASTEGMAKIERLAASLRYFSSLEKEAEKAAEIEDHRSAARARQQKKPRPVPPAPDRSEQERQRDEQAAKSLRWAKKEFSTGNPLEALLRLDAAITAYGKGPMRAKLVAQNDRWRGARTALIEELIGLGEAALGQERPKQASASYRKILLLDSGHELARDRLRKLEKLQAIQGAAGASSATGK